jgi:isopenicillin-N epimerase
MATPSPEEFRRKHTSSTPRSPSSTTARSAPARGPSSSAQAWQRDLENEPIDFFDRRLPALLDAARGVLADYVGCSAEDLAFVQNATTGVNLAARALGLGPGDEVLATNLEYGACDLAWDWVCRRAEARYVRAPIPLPLRDPSEVADAGFAHASGRTRVVYVSHVTSTTGLVLPLQEIVARARALGFATVVDGAHAPAQVPVDLASLGADFYAANAHKWLGAPKGGAFLHAQPEHQDRVEAAIVSWGYEEGSSFSERIEKQGTRDPAAWLTVPDAIRFQTEHDWDAVSERSRGLAREARRELCDLLGTEPLAPDSMVAQMATVRLPRSRARPLRGDSSLATWSRSPSAARKVTSCGSRSPPTRRATRSTGC